MLNTENAPQMDAGPMILVATSVFPLGGGGRIEKFVKLLPDYGVRPVVVSPWETQSENSQRLLAAAYPANLETHYVGSVGPTYFAERLQARAPHAKHYRLLSALSFPERCVYVPDHMVRWVPFAIRRARRLISEKGLRVVLTSSPPESTHLVGLWLKRHCDVKWIADFRDLWTARTLLYRPATPLHDRWIRRLERLILRTADHVIANTDENKAYYVKNFGVDPDRVSVIPNGFDRDDASSPSGDAKDRNVFTIGYMGNLAKHDLPWQPFFRGLRLLRDDVGASRIRFVHCGPASNEVNGFIRELNLDDLVIRHGELNHGDAMRITASTTLRLVLLGENGYSSAMVPAKLYNYLIMDGPILAVSPVQGAAARVLAETRTGRTVSPNDDGRNIYQHLLAYYEKWRLGERLVDPSQEHIDAYDRRRHAAALAEIALRLHETGMHVGQPRGAVYSVANTGD